MDGLEFGPVRNDTTPAGRESSLDGRGGKLVRRETGTVARFTLARTSPHKLVTRQRHYQPHSHSQPPKSTANLSVAIASTARPFFSGVALYSVSVISSFVARSFCPVRFLAPCAWCISAHRAQPGLSSLEEPEQRCGTGKSSDGREGTDTHTVVAELLLSTIGAHRSPFRSHTQTPQRTLSYL